MQVTDPPTLPLIQQLRQQTADAHRRLEKRTRLDTPRVSNTDYELFMRVIHAFVLRVEPALESFPAAWRRFSPSLCDRAARDLDHLALTPAPITESIRIPNDLDEAWGYAYVLEGARLGGRMLTRGFRSSDPDRPTRYLWSTEDEGRWADFRARLAEADAHEERVVNAACAAFADLEQGYDTLGHSGGSQ